MTAETYTYFSYHERLCHHLIFLTTCSFRSSIFLRICLSSVLSQRKPSSTADILHQCILSYTLVQKILLFQSIPSYSDRDNHYIRNNCLSLYLRNTSPHDICTSFQACIRYMKSLHLLQYDLYSLFSSKVLQYA